MMKKDDLISRAAAIEQIKRMPYWITPDGYCALTYDDIETAINNMPAVDVAPVVYGHWIEHEDSDGDSYYTCSACGCDWTTIDGTPAQNNMRFCPECGAKMDGERNLAFADHTIPRRHRGEAGD